MHRCLRHRLSLVQDERHVMRAWTCAWIDVLCSRNVAGARPRRGHVVGFGHDKNVALTMRSASFVGLRAGPHRHADRGAGCSGVREHLWNPSPTGLASGDRQPTCLSLLLTAFDTIVRTLAYVGSSDPLVNQRFSSPVAPRPLVRGLPR